MKALLMKEPWSIELADIEQRPVQEGEALLKIHMAGICGSDIGAFRGHNKLVSYPRIIGHELAAEVLSIPENNKKGIKVGDKVVCDPYLYCGKCYPCSIGRTNCCNELHVLGVHIDGGMAETFAHPADMLVKVPEDMTWEQMALAEPLTISLHGLHRLRLTAGEHIAIFGAGTIGLVAAMAAVSYGAIPILIDLVEERLAFARELGIPHTINLKNEDLLTKIAEYTNGRMCECAMEASGANAAVRSTIDVVCHAGRICFTGWPARETSLPTDLFTRKELDVRGARTSCNEFEEAIDMIYTKRVDMTKIVTKIVTAEEAPETLRDIEANPGNYLKVLIKF